MALVSGHPKSRLMKGFTALGPYIREGQCSNNHFFFDCLAVCINMQPSPEKREFYGWWIDLNAEEKRYTYAYHLGLFDKEGHWSEKKIGEQEVIDKLESSLRAFHKRLRAYIESLEMTLEPADSFNAHPFNLSSDSTPSLLFIANRVMLTPMYPMDFTLQPTPLQREG